MYVLKILIKLPIFFVYVLKCFNKLPIYFLLRWAFSVSDQTLWEWEGGDTIILFWYFLGNPLDQPPGYTVKGLEHKVFKLKKALYGLKQAPQAWYSRIDSCLINNGFSKSSNEPTMYVKTEQNKILIGCLYVDHMIYTGNLCKFSFNIQLGLNSVFK